MPSRSPSQPMASPRHDVAQRARDRLQQSPYHTVRRVSCRYDAGTLFLHGHLPDFFHLQVAQETVARLEGVDQVVNHIEVA